MAFKKKSSGKVFFSPLLDTLTIDQYMPFFSEFWYGFSYSTLNVSFERHDKLEIEGKARYGCSIY